LGKKKIVAMQACKSQIPHCLAWKYEALSSVVPGRMNYTTGV